MRPMGEKLFFLMTHYMLLRLVYLTSDETYFLMNKTKYSLCALCELI